MTKSNLPASISLWRKIVNKLMTILVLVAVALAIIPLILILGRRFRERGACHKYRLPDPFAYVHQMFQAEE